MSASRKALISRAINEASRTPIEAMKSVQLPFPELIGIAVTRAFLGAGLALLFGERLARRHRRVLGGILTAIGVLSTAPLAYDVLHHRRGT
jgi:hypothetical protein